MGRCILISLVNVALAIFSAHARADLSLGSAANFAVLAGAGVTNAGPSVINGGDMGVGQGSTITGFPPGSLLSPFTMHNGDAMALQALGDASATYNAATELSPTQNLTGQDLGGLTLTPGVYSFSSSAQLTGTLTLNALGDPNAQFVFLIGGALTSAINASVVTINGGSSPGTNVFWQVGSSATLGTNTEFEGNILALASITMDTGASITDGSAVALEGSVTLDTNSINGASVGAIPEPASITLTLIGGVLWGILGPRKKLREDRKMRSQLQNLSEYHAPGSSLRASERPNPRRA